MSEYRLPSDYQNFIHLSKYARFREELGRRETWQETVERYTNFFAKYITENHIKIEGSPKQKEFLDELEKAKLAILKLKVGPSMRALKAAGPALEKHHVAGYNCAFLPIDHPHAFDEILYISCCGTGIGFSVEAKHINKLPEIPAELYPTNTEVYVADSKMGWATALREIISLMYAGKMPKWDVSNVRPAGAILRTFGGRASGPGPLVDLFNFVIAVFKKAAGRRLTSLECHDIVCKIGLIAESGGTRRAALLSLSDLENHEMRYAKSGNWWDLNPQRSYSNNSVAYPNRPELGTFMEEWIALYRSQSGERGIFSFQGAKHASPRRDYQLIQGVNPCGEILLRANEFCNLTEVIVRPNDTYNTLREKARIATFLGTLQATLTKFKYIRKVWQKNCEEERLLGVSLTGIMDSPLLLNENSGELLQKLKQETIETNKYWSNMLGINESVAITTVKPSGNTSQLVDSASGIHPRFSKFYMRTVRMDKKDPLTTLMVDQKIPNEDCVLKPQTTTIFSFPVKSPDESVFRDQYNAIQQLELMKRFKLNWTEHNVSITIYVKETEWLDVASWVFKNFDIIGGVTFLPYDGGTYRQAPYQEIDEKAYQLMLDEMPSKVNWDKIADYEKEDYTTSARELACSSGSCELV
jgi:ribonucleoside-triphosphate reductase